MNIWRRKVTSYNTYFNVSIIRGLKLKAPGSRSHYDALGVTPSSTQAEIKTAYYKLSKLYHPDRNKGSDVAAAHFKTINEAYEILGNFKKRRMYDKGIPSMDGNSGPAPPEEMDPQTRFYRSRGSTATGKTPIYDFDEWSREHYGTAFKRREKAKEKYERKMQGQVAKSGDLEKESVIYISIVVFVIFGFFNYLQDRASYDVDKVTPKRNNTDTKS